VILATVGSTHFDNLIKAVDSLALRISDNIVCQIGLGTYIPENCDYFRFDNNFEEKVKNSELVITHGGATVFQCISLKKKFIAISNGVLADDHQTAMLKTIHNHINFPWSSNCDDLEKLYFDLGTFDYKLSNEMKLNLTDYLIDSITR
jgi:beta-1,4-N-acetylglucosaminyltransferase